MGYLIPYVLLQRHYHTLKGDGSIRYVPFLAVQTILLVLPLTILQANMAHFSQWWGMALAYIGANLLLDLLLVQTFRAHGARRMLWSSASRRKTPWCRCRWTTISSFRTTPAPCVRCATT